MAFSLTMPLHMIKLSVGTDDIDDLTSWVAERIAQKRARGEEPVHIHRTRSAPKRRDEILDGGSMYWIIKGVVQLREPILDLRAVVDGQGVPHCDIVLSGEFVRVEPRQWRPFQGWRYLEAKDAPRDLASIGGGELPPELVRELAALGLL